MLSKNNKDFDYSKIGDEKTGMDCAKFLVDNGIVPKKFYVHSMNVVGADNILCFLNNGNPILSASLKDPIEKVIHNTSNDCTYRYCEYPSPEYLFSNTPFNS